MKKPRSARSASRSRSRRPSHAPGGGPLGKRGSERVVSGFQDARGRLVERDRALGRPTFYSPPRRPEPRPPQRHKVSPPERSGGVTNRVRIQSAIFFRSAWSLELSVASKRTGQAARTAARRFASSGPDVLYSHNFFDFQKRSSASPPSRGSRIPQRARHLSTPPITARGVGHFRSLWARPSRSGRERHRLARSPDRAHVSSRRRAASCSCRTRWASRRCPRMRTPRRSAWWTHSRGL